MIFPGKREAAQALALGAWITVALCSASARAETESSARRSGLAYSSSYLAFNRGDILRLQNPSRLDCDEAVCRVTLPDGEVFRMPKEIGERSKGTLAEKFSAVAGSMGLMSGDQVSELNRRLAREYYRPEAPGWFGSCHQWSFGSQNPAILGLVRGSLGLLCNGAFFSLGELKELFTLFYQKLEAQKVLGFPSETEPAALEKNPWLADLTYSREVYHRLTGRDDLPADYFHKWLHASLKADQPVVIDLMAGYEKWNHPVLAGVSTLEDLGPAFHQDPSGIVLPPGLFEATRAATEAQVEDLECATRVYDRISDSVNESDTVTANSELIKALKACGPEQLSGVDEAFRTDVFLRGEQILRSLHGKVASMLAGGAARLKTGLSLKQVSTELTVRTETKFAENFDLSKRVSYRYVLLEEKGKIIGGYWVTKPSARPDYLVIPDYTQKSGPDSRKPADVFDAGLEATMKLFENCVDVSSVLEYRALEASRPAKGSNQEKRMRELFPKVEKYL